MFFEQSELGETLFLPADNGVVIFLINSSGNVIRHRLLPPYWSGTILRGPLSVSIIIISNVRSNCQMLKSRVDSRLSAWNPTGGNRWMFQVQPRRNACKVLLESPVGNFRALPLCTSPPGWICKHPAGPSSTRNF